MLSLSGVNDSRTGEQRLKMRKKGWVREWIAEWYGLINWQKHANFVEKLEVPLSALPLSPLSGSHPAP